MGVSWFVSFTVRKMQSYGFTKQKTHGILNMCFPTTFHFHFIDAKIKIIIFGMVPQKPINNLFIYIHTYIHTKIVGLNFFNIICFAFHFRCMCPAGYTGKNCESKYVPCSPSPCQNGGTCRSTGLTYECKCPEGEYQSTEHQHHF